MVSPPIPRLSLRHGQNLKGRGALNAIADLVDMATGYISPVSMHMKQLQMHCPSLARKAGTRTTKTGKGCDYSAASSNAGKGEYGFQGFSSDLFRMKGKPTVNFGDSQCTTAVDDKGFNSIYSDDVEDTPTLLDMVSMGAPLEELSGTEAGTRLPQRVLMLLSNTANLWKEDDTIEQHTVVEPNHFEDKADKPDSGKSLEEAQSPKQPVQAQLPDVQAPTLSMKGVRVKNLLVSKTNTSGCSPTSSNSGFGPSSSTQVYMPKPTMFRDEVQKPDAVQQQANHVHLHPVYNSAPVPAPYQQAQRPDVVHQRASHANVYPAYNSAPVPAHNEQAQRPDVAQQQASHAHVYPLYNIAPVPSHHEQARSHPGFFRAPPGLQEVFSERDAANTCADAYESEMNEPDSDLEDEPTTVLVGPSPLASAPYSLQQVAVPDPAFRQKVFIKSGVRQLALSDAFRLKAGGNGVPLSFGSAVHLAHGERPSCRPCMYERWAGRCSKKWLCDFCHLHVGSKRRTKVNTSVHDRFNLCNSFRTPVSSAASPPVSHTGVDSWMVGHPLRQRL